MKLSRHPARATRLSARRGVACDALSPTPPAMPQKRAPQSTPLRFALAALCAFFIIHSTFFISRAAAQQPNNITGTPLLPNIDGTYYYEGYDAATDRFVYTSTSGLYYYVDTAGFTTAGGTSSLPVATPYRAVISGTLSTFQFYNNHPDLATLATTATDFSPRSGTWFASDITFKQSANTAGAAISIDGVSGTFPAQPVTFIGANVNAIVDVANNTGQQALAIRNGAAVYLTGGTLSKTVTAAGDGSETIYMSGNQTGNQTNNQTSNQSANANDRATTTYFHGENLAIISTGAGLETFNLAAGSNTVDLVNSTITSTMQSTGYTAVINLAGGDPALGGNHFTGTNLLIDITGTANNRAIYMGQSGNNTVTLVSATLNIAIAGSAITGSTAPIWLDSRASTEGNHFNGDDLTITNAAGRLFVFDYGANTIALKNSTIATAGKGAVFAWAESEATANEARADGYTSLVALENTAIATTADYAPIFQQVGRYAAALVTGGTLATNGAGSPILRLVGANDALDDTRFTAVFTNALLDARNSSAIDLDIAPTETANYGWAGGGAKEITASIKTTWNLTFQSSTLNGTSSFRIATATGGNPQSPYYNYTYIYANDSAINGSIDMTLTGTGDSSGAHLILTASNTRFTGGYTITGIENARNPHQAELRLTDSSFAGNITATNRGLTALAFANTPITGDLTLSGSTQTYLDLSNSPIHGRITLAGTALLANTPGLNPDNRPAALRDTPVTGGISLAGSSTLDLTLTGPASVISNGLAATDNATATLRLEDNSTLTGGVTASGSSTVTLLLTNATQLTGDLLINDRARLAIATFNATPVHLDRGLTLAGTWAVSVPTTLAGKLAITNPLGTIAIENAAPDTLTLASGLTGAGRLDILSIDGAALGTPEIRVIHDLTNTFTTATPAPLILARPIDYGLASYTLQNRPDGAYLVGGLATGAYGAGGAAVFNSQALAAEDWFNNLSPITDRLEQLRQSNTAIFLGNAGVPPADEGRPDLRPAPAFSPRATGDTGSYWLKATADTTNVTRSGPSLNFTSRAFAIAAGVDARWDYLAATVTTGAFAETTRADRAFISGADGRTTGAGGGLYASYHRRDGLFASAIARFDINETTLDTNSPNNALKANYHTKTAGLALEAGKRIHRADGWWLEPAYQFALAALPGVTYATQSTRPSNNIDITIGSARAIQNALRLSFGRYIGKNWDLNGRALVAHTLANGGKFTAPGLREADFLIDGLRFEAALGLSHPVWRNGRLTIDATTVLSAAYKRPCGIALGYAHNW